MSTACPKCGYDASAVAHGSWTFTIERAVHSLNKQGTNRGRWSAIRAYKAARTAWAWEMRAARLNLHIPIPVTRRRVTLTRLYAGREQEFDHDNLVGGCKLVVDVMAREGLIIGDKPAEAEIHYMQQRGATSGLVVLIEEMGT